MASDSPGTYGRCAHSSDSHDLSDLLQDTSCSRGNYQMNVVGGFQRDGLPIKDSGYYVNTSDGASTCSSSTTETGEIEGGTLLVLEPKSLRSFTTNDEYLYAMKEDLADWFACLYQRDDINADNFFHILETGVLLCRHANKVQEFARQRREMGETLEMRSYFIRSVPEGNVGYREAVKPETFQARDNVSNFISWGRQLGIPEVLSFETDDLVLRKNEKSVILCLLEIARVGAKLGMLAPTLIQMEQEIDAELAGEEPKPQIQIITCDMRSLDERVRDLIGRCTCPVQFPMIKVGEGKYKIGDSRSLIFVRILRNHVMVRVGGGWDTLENYLNKHDPCQCNYRGHRPSNAGLAHKVAFSQQRPPATPNTTVCRTTPNTPTSPRRGSTAAATAAADRHRSTSPQNSNTKAPTVIISRQMPTPSKRSTDAAGQSKGGRVLPTQSVASEDSLQPSSCLSSQQAGCKSANPAHRRSISPQTSSLSSSSGLPLPKSVQQTSCNASPVKAKDLSHEHKMLTPKKNKNKLVDSDNDDNEAVDTDGYVAEDDECDNPHRPDHPGSESFDDKGNSDSSSSDLQHMRKSDTANPADGAEKSSMNIDKISTMTLAEFKSMLSSSLSVPEEQKQGSRELQEGRSSEQPQGMPSRTADPNHWNSLNQKASSGSDSALSDIYAKQIVDAGQGGNEESVFWINRPKAHTVLQRNAEESNTADILRPKTPTSLSRSKMSKPSAEIERTAPKEEYKMARPKPVSQIKRDAVAKVAGAISNWVESRNDADSTETLYRPKTPTRPKTLVGPHSSFHQDLLQEDDEGDHLEAVDTATSSLMQSLANASKDRPVTPSRIPKPSFIPRPKTPSSFTAEFPGEASSQSPLIPNLTRLNIALANRPAALSRSNSNSSSVKSVDETPVSPASSFSEDRMFKVHSRARRLSNSSDSFNAGNSAALTNSINSSASAALSSSTNTSGRSYKDIYVAKKAATDCRVPPTRAVTPGPREKWTLGGSSGVSALESQNPAPNTQRRRSINTVNKTDSQTLTKSTAPASPIRRTSSASNIEVEPMTITNEIAFSDDEEINEIIKNAALRIKKQTIRSSSVGARKYAHQHAKQNEEEVLMICRDQNMKDTVINNTASKYNIVRRPSSRGSSNGRGSPVTVVSRFSQAAGSSMHQQKTQPLHKSKKIDGRDSPVSSSQSAHKNMNRTEAWVDTTLADDKKKPVPPPKQVKAYMIAARELASRPLEEIQAILSEPKNGFVNVDARGLEAPAEDPAMYRKMEKLFEKYREMELKASMNEVLSHGGVRAAIKDKLADTQSTKSDSHRLVHGASRPSMNVSSLKISSGAAVSAAGHSTGQNPAAPISCRTPSNDGNKLTKSSSTPFQNILHQTSTSNSPVMESSYQESKDYFNLDNSSETTKSKTPDPDSEHRGLGFLQDIDPELAKNPAALISKIKEILKVRPRKDENTKGPTRIPAPAKLNKRNRSKSVSNLYSDCMIDANSDSSHDLHESQPDGTSVFHNTESQSCYDDERSLKKSSNLVSEDVASSEDAPADTMPDLMSISVNFDSNDNQNRSETPLPKMATPLTTGRSTLISRKVDKFARNMSQDKENMSTSQSTISSLSVLTPTEDQAEFV